jgi:hypothetical protein
MPVVSAEMKWMRSSVFNNTDGNGGRMSNS